MNIQSNSKVSKEAKDFAKVSKEAYAFAECFARLILKTEK